MENNDNETPQPKKVAKKREKKDEALVKNTIEINPKLEEAKGGTVVLAWGRMNPITIGHEKLVKKLQDVARKQNATPIVYLTHTQNAKKDPLSYDDKIMLAQKAFGYIVQKSASKTIIQVMQELQKKYSNVVLVVGSDRVSEFNTLLNKYNGKDYSFDSIEVVSAGERDADADDVSGMSASKMRNLASEGDFETFKKGLPKKLQRNAQDIYDMVRGGMKIAEQMELDEAVLTLQQRRQRGIQMRRYKNKIMAARKRLAKRPATQDKLKLRARKAAIQKIRAMVAGKKGQSYQSLSPSEKIAIDKKVEKRKKAIDRIALKLLPKMKLADRERLSARARNANEEFEAMVEAYESTKSVRHHQARNKDGTMKFDKRFRSFKKFKEAAEVDRVRDDHKDERELSRQMSTEDIDILNIVDEIHESIERDNVKVINKINEKAEQSGTLSDDLFEIYYDAIEEEHDYDMTPQQYGFAAINTYLANLANLKEGVNDPGILKAVFLAGGPGSGKSFIVGKTALSVFGLKLINSDDAFEAALTKVGLKPTPEDIFSPKGQEVRGRAKALTAMKQKLAMNGRLGLTIDGTGKDFAKIQKQAIALKRLGYDIAMIFVNTDLDTAQERNAARSRTLPADEVEKMWSDVQRNIGKFQNFFGRNMFIVDNSEGANWEGAVTSAYKRIGAWTKEPPKNPVALKWIKDAKAQRGIKESYTREQLPQIRNIHLESINHTMETVHIDDIIPVQEERNIENFNRQLTNISEGNYRPIIVDCDNKIINGHHRYEALQMLEYTEIQVAKLPLTLEQILEELKVSDGLGAWIKDFQDSDAPQFKNADKEKRRKMAIAAFADAGGDLNEGISAKMSQKQKERQKERFTNSVTDAMHRLVKSKGQKQSIGGYAFDIARSYGLKPKEVEKMYLDKYGAAESLDDAFDDVIDEAYGDMDRGTPSLTKKYMKDTPYQEVDSDIVKAKDGSYTYKGTK